MNAAAQNAMLKLLEEPPARSVFILAAADEDAVLETVRSRCTALYAEGDEELGDADKYALALFDSFRRGSEADVALAAWQLEKAKLEREELDGVLELLSIPPQPYKVMKASGLDRLIELKRRELHEVR